MSSAPQPSARRAQSAAKHKQGKKALRAGCELESQATAQRYRCESLLSAGAFASVWLCTNSRTGKKCAIKLSPHDQNNPFDELFCRQGLADQKTDYIPRFYEESAAIIVGQPHSRFQLTACEYIEGASASELCRGDSIPWNPASRILLDILEALIQLHSARVVHGFVRAENVAVSWSGRSYLCNVAQHHADLPHRLSLLELVAPELHTAKTDVWGWGILAVRLATGGRATATQEESGHQEGQKIPRPHDYPVKFGSAVGVCLHSLPDARPDADQLLMEFPANTDLRLYEDVHNYVKYFTVAHPR